MKEHIISVIIPLFNKEHSICQTVDSVLQQSFTNFELLVIDDGSNDDSLKNISHIQDLRLKIFTKENGGVSDARNFGINKATGSFIFLLDADDLIKENCLETLHNLSELYPAESVFCANYQTMKSNVIVNNACCKLASKSLIVDPIKELWRDNIFLRTGNVLIKKECFDVVGGFNKKLSFYEDMDHVLNLIRKYNVVFDPQVILTYQLDYTDLSKKIVPIERDWACSTTFNNKSFYEKLIIGNIVYASLRKRQICRDYNGVSFLIRRHFLFFGYIFGGKLTNKLVKMNLF